MGWLCFSLKTILWLLDHPVSEQRRAAKILATMDLVLSSSLCDAGKALHANGTGFNAVSSARHQLYQEDCLCHQGSYIKDLSVLERDLGKVVAVATGFEAFPYQVMIRLNSQAHPGRCGCTFQVDLLANHLSIPTAPSSRTLVQKQPPSSPHTKSHTYLSVCDTHVVR